MTNYRRHVVPGGSYFFTVNLADRRQRILTDHIDLLRTAVRDTRALHPFVIEAIVVLPDHLHAIWSLPPNDSDYATRWRLIKLAFSRALPCSVDVADVGWVERSETHHEYISPSRASKAERGIWQRRYWEHTLRDEADFARCADYIHFNSVKHGHAVRVADWPFSSFHRFVRRGVYSLDWGGDRRDDAVGIGERQGA